MIFIRNMNSDNAKALGNFFELIQEPLQQIQSFKNHNQLKQKIIGTSEYQINVNKASKISVIF